MAPRAGLCGCKTISTRVDASSCKPTTLVIVLQSPGRTRLLICFDPTGLFTFIGCDYFHRSMLEIFFLCVLSFQFQFVINFYCVSTLHKGIFLPDDHCHCHSYHPSLVRVALLEVARNFGTYTATCDDSSVYFSDLFFSRSVKSCSRSLQGIKCP